MANVGRPLVCRSWKYGLPLRYRITARTARLAQFNLQPTTSYQVLWRPQCTCSGSKGWLAGLLAPSKAGAKCSSHGRCNRLHAVYPTNHGSRADPWLVFLINADTRLPQDYTYNTAERLAYHTAQ